MAAAAAAAAKVAHVAVAAPLRCRTRLTARAQATAPAAAAKSGAGRVPQTRWCAPDSSRVVCPLPQVKRYSRPVGAAGSLQEECMVPTNRCRPLGSTVPSLNRMPAWTAPPTQVGERTQNAAQTRQRAGGSAQWSAGTDASELLTAPPLATSMWTMSRSRQASSPPMARGTTQPTGPGSMATTVVSSPRVAHTVLPLMSTWNSWVCDTRRTACETRRGDR